MHYALKPGFVTYLHGCSKSCVLGSARSHHSSISELPLVENRARIHGHGASEFNAIAYFVELGATAVVLGHWGDCRGNTGHEVI